MDYVQPETKPASLGAVVAWSAFTVGLGCVAYLELINHRLIGTGGLRAGIAHATIFASLTVCLMGAAGHLRVWMVCLLAAALATAAECIEVVPTSAGTLENWAASMTGIGLTWFGVRHLGRPRSDLAMALAILLWAIGLGCAFLTLQDKAYEFSDAAANTARILLLG